MIVNVYDEMSVTVGMKETKYKFIGNLLVV